VQRLGNHLLEGLRNHKEMQMTISLVGAYFSHCTTVLYNSILSRFKVRNIIQVVDRWQLLFYSDHLEPVVIKHCPYLVRERNNSAVAVGYSLFTGKLSSIMSVHTYISQYCELGRAPVDWLYCTSDYVSLQAYIVQ